MLDWDVCCGFFLRNRVNFWREERKKRANEMPWRALPTHPQRQAAGMSQQKQQARSSDRWGVLHEALAAKRRGCARCVTHRKS
jgi:hypothetical protein